MSDQPSPGIADLINQQQAAPPGGQQPAQPPEGEPQPGPDGRLPPGKETRQAKPPDSPSGEPPAPDAGDRKAPSSSDWADFIERSRDLDRGLADLKAKTQQLDQREKSVEQYLADIEEFNKDPISWAEKKGLDYEEWTRRILGNGKPEPIPKTVQRELDQVKQQNEELRQQLQELAQTREQAQTDAQIQQAMQQLDQIMADSRFDPVRQYAQAYEAFTGQPVDVHEAAKALALQHYQAYQQDLTLPELADTLLSEAQARLQRLPESAKSALLGNGSPHSSQPPSAPPAQGAQQHQPPAGGTTSQQPPEGSHTLTAGDETHDAPPVDLDKLDWRERLALARQRYNQQK